MRKHNSLFQTDFISEQGMEEWNHTYYGYVELDRFYCLAIAESHDGDVNALSAKLAVDTVISLFTQKPSMKRTKVNGYMRKAHEELKLQSVKTQLKASLLIIVSDYTRFRYVSCGNIMMYWLRDGRLLDKSKTHTIYQQMADREEVPEDGISGLEEASNIYSFLGSQEHFTTYVSPKHKMEDGDLLLAGTQTYWKRVTCVELLDAFGDMKSSGEFLEDLQDLLLSSQGGGIDYFPEREILGSYCLASVFTEKVYREKIKNKKKWIIIGIVLILVTAVLITGIIHIKKRSARLQKELIRRVEQYEEKGSQYFVLEYYDAALTQYEKAIEEAQDIKDKNQKLEIQQGLEGKTTLLNEITAAEKAYEEKNYKDAKERYLTAKNQAAAYEDLDLSSVISKKLRQADIGIEISALIEYAQLLEGKPDYEKAIEVYEYINEMLRILGKTEDMQEMNLNIFRLEQLLSKEEEAAKEKEDALKDKKKAEEKQAKEEEEQAKEKEKQTKIKAIAARQQEVDQAVKKKDFDSALAISKEMWEGYLSIEAFEEADEVYNRILELMDQREEEKERQKEEEQAEEMKKINAKKLLAEQALLEGDTKQAREIYWDMCIAYIELGQVEAASEIIQKLLSLNTVQNGSLSSQKGTGNTIGKEGFLP